MSYISFKFRIKDSTTGKRLAAHAIACNQVWNYCVATQREAQTRWRAGCAVRWPTHFDLVNLTLGSAALLGLHSCTVDKICAQFVASRSRHKKCPGFRSSFGRRRALGFVPYRARYIRLARGRMTLLGENYRFWQSRDLLGDFKYGAFVEDARGRWYATFQCEVTDDLKPGAGAVGIDLGLKHMATLSDGRKVAAKQHYRKYEEALATAQRAGNRDRVRAIHAKITNCRRHHLHQESTRLANEFGLIVVGNVKAAQLAKTRMGKSILDAGWSAFRAMLKYKAARRQAVYVEADERNTSRTCSCCGAIPDSSPKGMGAIRIRHWECSDCGASHDRDVNAALNILRVGLECQPPAGEMLKK